MAPAKSRKSEEKKLPSRERPHAKTPRFGGLELSEVMHAALEAADYTTPTPIQATLIPKALEGRDFMGQAQTGTGKTAAFAVPILERLSRRSRGGPQAIILVPTRELAVQVRDEFVKLARGRRVAIIAVYGGTPIRKQTEQLQRGTEVVVGTPGRVLDHIERRTLDLSDIQMLVLDEADRMLDIGFRPDIEKILRRCPEGRQTLLLSATIPPPVRRLAERYMHSPEVLDCSPQQIDVQTIEQSYFTVSHEDKFPLLIGLLKRERPTQAIIFCRTKRGTEKVFQRLSRRLEGVAAIHGDLQQRVRDRVMSQFRQGLVKCLVATDVVGRGIDVTGISHIINYDIPQFCDDYVHRVGRTGRMGREGVAFTFVTPEEGAELTRIEMRINRLLHREETSKLLPHARPVTMAPADASQPSRPHLPRGVTPESDLPEPPARKTVFGRSGRRVRRAL